MVTYNENLFIFKSGGVTMKLSITKSAIVTGCVVGVLSAGVLMIPNSRESEAAIPVIDQENIKQAYQIAVNTLEQIAIQEFSNQLQKINMQSLGANVSAAINGAFKTQQDSILAGDMQLPSGISNINISVDGKRIDWRDIAASTGIIDANWAKRIGLVDNVLNGNISWQEIATQEIERQMTLDEEYRAAAEAGAQAQMNMQNIADTTNKALEASNNAEGQKEVLQAQNALTATQISATQEQTRVLAHMAGAQAAKAAAENIEKAQQKRIEKATSYYAQKWLDNVKIGK